MSCKPSEEDICGVVRESMATCGGTLACTSLMRFVILCALESWDMGTGVKLHRVKSE